MASWSLEGVAVPGGRGAIYEFIRGQLGELGALPDDEPREANRLSFAPGALDGILTHHTPRRGAAAENLVVFDKLLALLGDVPGPSAFADFYAAVLKAPTKDTLRGIRDNADSIDIRRLHALALWLAKKAPDRAAVKFGLSLLAIAGSAEEDELLLTLGRHEEFTRDALTALVSHDTPEATIWALAKSVKGWGRIDAVERLAKTTDPAIRAWLLREGFRNTVLWEYLTLVCATAGGLAQALGDDTIDASLLQGAGHILASLTDRQGPAGNIEHYSDRVTTIADYLRHFAKAEPTLDDFVSLSTIADFLAGEEDWHALGWSPELLVAQRTQASALLAQPSFRALAEAGLLSSDAIVFNNATRAAARLQIDVWPHYFAATERGGPYWYWLLDTRDLTRARKVLALAEEKLPLAEPERIANAFALENPLGHLVQWLRAFPGLGWPLIVSALQSPSLRLRNGALETLAEWPLEHWTDDAKTQLAAVLSTEQEEAVRARLTDLLARIENDPAKK